MFKLCRHCLMETFIVASLDSNYQNPSVFVVVVVVVVVLMLIRASFIHPPQVLQKLMISDSCLQMK